MSIIFHINKYLNTYWSSLASLSVFWPGVCAWITNCSSMFASLHLFFLVMVASLSSLLWVIDLEVSTIAVPVRSAVFSTSCQRAYSRIFEGAFGHADGEDR